MKNIRRGKIGDNRWSYNLWKVKLIRDYICSSGIKDENRFYCLLIF